MNKKLTGLTLGAILCVTPLTQAASWCDRLTTYVTTAHDRNEPKPPYTHQEGALKENEKAEAKTQRENHYEWSKNIAEFWCTLSNAAFVYAGYAHGAPEVALAGLTSAAYHAHPTQKMLIADRTCAVVAALGTLARVYFATGNLPAELVWILPTTLAVAATDDLIANTTEKNSWWFKFTPLWHSVWHFTAAYCAHRLLCQIK